MNEQQIAKHLCKKLNFEEMRTLASRVGRGELSCAAFIQLCEHSNHQIAFRASWTLEFIAYAYADVFRPYQSSFLRVYPKIKNPSAQRSFTKIMMLLTQSDYLRENKIDYHALDACLSVTFEWLLDPKTPLAVQCNALDVIYQLSHLEDWILDELHIILQNKLVSNSPALVSRSKKILKAIHKKKQIAV